MYKSHISHIYLSLLFPLPLPLYLFIFFLFPFPLPLRPVLPTSPSHSPSSCTFLSYSLSPLFLPSLLPLRPIPSFPSLPTPPPFPAAPRVPPPALACHGAPIQMTQSAATKGTFKTSSRVRRFIFFHPALIADSAQKREKEEKRKKWEKKPF